MSNDIEGKNYIITIQTELWNNDAYLQRVKYTWPGVLPDGKPNLPYMTQASEKICDLKPNAKITIDKILYDAQKTSYSDKRFQCLEVTNGGKKGFVWSIYNGKTFITPDIEKKKKHTFQVKVSSGAANPIIPLAGWKLDDVYFAFDKWFILSSASLSFSLLKEVFDKTADGLRQQGISETPKISLFGHTDQVGDMKVNKIISEKRAMAVYGVLLKDVSIWKELYQQPNDIEYLRTSLGMNAGSSFDAKTESMVRTYMNSLCSDAYTKSDFIGNGDHACQGCSKFNHLVILSRQEFTQLSEKEWKFQGQFNRRVVGYLFMPTIDLAKDKWPCPKPDQSYTSCINAKQIESNWDKIIDNPKPKEFKKKEQTMSCKFYQSLADYVSCEYFYEPPLIAIDKDSTNNDDGCQSILDTISTVEIKNKGKVRVTGSEEALQNSYQLMKAEYTDRSRKIADKYTNDANSRSAISVFKLVNDMTFEEFKKFEKYLVMAVLRCSYNSGSNTYTVTVYENITNNVLYAESVDSPGPQQFSQVANLLYPKLKGSQKNIVLRVYEEILKKRK